MSGEDTDIFSESITVQDGPHHSTPIKDGPFKRPARPGRVTARVEPTSPGRYAEGEGQQVTRSSADRSQQRYKSRHSKMVSMMATSVPQMDNSTVEKQRREIQLLIQELRDRDGELNETVSAHSQQLLAWERDRQRLLTLEQKNARYESELQRKRKQLEAAMLKLKSARNETQNNSTSLSLTQDQLQQLSLQKQSTEVHVDNLEKQNVSLNDSLKAMSGTLGQLEAREQELITLLRIKDREIDQATSTVLDLNSRVQQLDLRCQECQNREAEALHRATQWKQKYTQARTEIETLSDTVKSKDSELESKGREMSDVHTQMSLLQEEMLISVDRERRKDDMIESLRAKQERTLAELRSVRELYERQQREITLMQLNLDSSKENSNQNSHLDYSISLDESITSQPIQPIQPVSPQPRDRSADSRHVSFEERLSTFLDVETDTEAVSHLDSSPASKLQRLLTESRHMIESLEKTTLPSSTSQENDCSVGQQQPGDQTLDSPVVTNSSSHSSNTLQTSPKFKETHDNSVLRQANPVESRSRATLSQSYQREYVGTFNLRTSSVTSHSQQFPGQSTSSQQTPLEVDSVNPAKNMSDNFLNQHPQTNPQSHVSNVSGKHYENDSQISDRYSQQPHTVNLSNFVQQSHYQQNAQGVSQAFVRQYHQTNVQNSSDKFALQSQEHQSDFENSTNNFVKQYPGSNSENQSGNFVKESHGQQDDIHGTSNNFITQYQQENSQSKSNNLSEFNYQESAIFPSHSEGSLSRFQHCHSPILAGQGFGETETSEILRRQVNT